MGNITSVTRLAGTSNAVTTSFTYETQFHQLASVTDPLGNITHYVSDGLNQPTQVTDPQGNTTAFSYDPNGNLSSVTDAKLNPTGYTYDTMDRLATESDPLRLPSEGFQYDGNGNLTQ